MIRFQRFTGLLCLVSTLSGPVLSQAGNELGDSSAYFQTASKRPVRNDHSREIERLIRQMTVEEKVGQMTQLTIDMVTKGDDQSVEIDQEKLEKAIVKYGVGSILNVNNQAITLDHWRRIIGPIQQAAARTRLKIPVIYGVDSIHGANYVQGATLFPQELGMASTWNPQLMQRAAEIAAMETRAAGIPWSFSPVLDVGRNAMWPRLWETFGEDPYLATVMGTAFVRGLEGTDVASGKHVATSLKHYVGYSLPLHGGRDRTPSYIPEHALREFFLPPFAEAVKAGARTVMVNSAEINGVPGHINKHLLTDVLKDELGFDGFVVTDWDDIKKLVSQWKVAADEKEATRLAILAGNDMSMVPLSFSFSDHLVELVKEKKISMSRIDDAVRRILRVKYELGLFDNAMPDNSLRANFGRVEYAETALQAARESVVLLKNDDNILPLAKAKKILVTGPTADSLISLNNGWTYVWQGSEPSLYPKEKPTIQAAIAQKLGGGNVIFVPGTRIIRKPGSPSNSNPTNIDQEVDIAAAVNAARNADAIVLCLGEGSYTEHPGNIADLTLPDIQLKLAEAVIATGKPVVVVLAQGRPRIINRIVSKVEGIITAFNPGNEGGRAIADVIFGDYNPDGKLPITYPKFPGYFPTYDVQRFERVTGGDDFAPLFEFGHGLSFTKFEYTGLTVSPTANGVNIAVTVRNAGQRAGNETAILFVRDEVAELTPAAKRVKRFIKIGLESGESRILRFSLTKADLSYIGLANKPVFEAGEFTALVGGLMAKFEVK